MVAIATQETLGFCRKDPSYEPPIATDGFRASSKLLKESPILMTLDLSMPGLDGYDVLAYVRATEEVSNTRILVISALDDASLNKALESGADAVLRKPFDNSQLLTTIQQLLDD